MVSTFLARKTGGTYRALATATALPDVLDELGALIGEHHRAVRDRYRPLRAVGHAHVG